MSILFPNYRDRLRPASFVSPSGIESEFLVDTLKKKSGKKISTQEIIDSDESVSQDQGNKTNTFPMSIYFIGDEFDITMSDFEVGLTERYYVDTPGILKHPLWGDINVFPVSWDQNIELVKGVGVGRIEIEFVEVFPRKYPESTLNNTSLVGANLDDMSFIDSAAAMITATASAAANIAGKIQAVVGVISSAIEFVEAVEDTVTEIQNDINSMIDDVAGNISQLLFAVQRLQRLPSRIQDSTMNKINTYKEMCGDIASVIIDDAETDLVNLKNNAIMVQSFLGYATACLSEAALFTIFGNRKDIISTISSLDDTLSDYNTSISGSWTDGNISNEYSGDHNFQLLLFDSIARTKDILLNQSFDLKAEKKFKLKNNSDIIDLCYEYYPINSPEDLQYYIEYFIATNGIKNDEFCELPIGRQIVVYV